MRYYSLLLFSWSIFSAIFCGSTTNLELSKTENQSSLANCLSLPWHNFTSKGEEERFIRGKFATGKGHLIKVSELSSWSDVPFDDKKIEYFFIENGDYTNLSTLKLSEVSGTQNHPKYIVGVTSSENGYIFTRRRDPNNNPDPSQEVILNSLRLFQSSHWIFSGLTFLYTSEPTGIVITVCSNNNILDNLITENFPSQHVRIINSSHNYIQNSILHTTENAFQDLCNLSDNNIGVQIQAFGPHDPCYNSTNCSSSISDYRNLKGCNNGESRGNVICNNIIYDLVDGIASFYKNRPFSGCCEPSFRCCIYLYR